MLKALKIGVMATVAAASLATVAAPAQARDWDGYHRGGDATGAAIAGGVIGLALGAAIASSNHPSYDNYSYGYSDYSPAYYGGGYYAPTYYGGTSYGYGYNRGYGYSHEYNRGYGRGDYDRRGYSEHRGYEGRGGYDHDRYR